MKPPNGLVDPQFWDVARLLRRQVRASGSGGAALCVYYRGQPVVDTWEGVRDDRGTPWEADTLCMSFSTTKGVTAAALHVLVDRGLVDVDKPIAHYWPEFSREGKGELTLRHVLSHRAGLYNIHDLVEDGRHMYDWDLMVRALERARPAHPPGGRPTYHGLTYGWLVGEVICRVTGQAFSEAIQDLIARPLGLEGLYVGAPAEARAKAAMLPRSAPPDPRAAKRAERVLRVMGLISKVGRLGIDPKYARDALSTRVNPDALTDPAALEPSIPAANGLFSARSLARLYATIGNPELVDGPPLLSAETLARASEVQTRARDRVMMFAPHWRLGWHSALTTRGRLRNGFGHFGYGGSGAWVDPKRELALAMTNNQVGGGPLGDMRIAQLGAAAVRCASRVAGTRRGRRSLAAASGGVARLQRATSTG